MSGRDDAALVELTHVPSTRMSTPDGASTKSGSMAQPVRVAVPAATVAESREPTGSAVSRPPHLINPPIFRRRWPCEVHVPVALQLPKSGYELYGAFHAS